jgi:ABC-2 type transport system ATP-binding protein
MGLAIEARALCKRFAGTRAVSDLSLRVRTGEVFGFLGPNGAGKTTSLKLLLGLVRPTGGEGFLLGAPLGDVKTRARIGYLPEHFRFHDWLSGRQLLHFHGRLCGMHRKRRSQRIEALLSRLGLGDAADRRVREYSKGMRQRLGLAQALINEPDLVLLDEPTSGLDPLGRRLVRDVIREQRRRGATVFLNSHLLGEVEVTCDRVAFIKRGRIVQEHDLHAETGGVEVAMRLDRSPETLLEGLSRFGEVRTSDDRRVVLRTGSEEVLPELTRWLAAQGAGLYELRRDSRSLEELFLEIVGAEEEEGPWPES